MQETGNGAVLAKLRHIPVRCVLSPYDRLDNIRAALARDLPRFSLQPANDTPAVLACFGPSLKQTWPAVKVAQLQGAKVMSVSGAHDFLLLRGIVPDYHAEIDPRPHKAKFLASPHPGVSYLIASSCHPKTFDAVSGRRVTMFHALEEDILDEIWWLDPQATDVVKASVNVGITALFLLDAMGHRSIAVHGMDCSYEGGGSTHAGHHFGKPPTQIEIHCGGRPFLSSHLMAETAQEALSISRHMAGHMTIDLHGDGLLQHMMRAAMQAPDDTDAAPAAQPEGTS